MIIKSIVTEKWALSVFEHFKIDRKLPKHFVPPDPNTPSVQGGSIYLDSENWGVPADGNSESAYGGGLRRLWHNWRRKKRRKRSEFPTGKTDPIEVFGHVRDSMEELVKYGQRMQAFNNGIKVAQDAGSCDTLLKMEVL